MYWSGIELELDLQAPYISDGLTPGTLELLMQLLEEFRILAEEVALKRASFALAFQLKPSWTDVVFGQESDIFEYTIFPVLKRIA